MSISGDWEKPGTEWRDHHHLSMLIMMTDMTVRPSQAFLSCCGTFSSQNKAPQQFFRAQQKLDIFYCCLLCFYLLFITYYLSFAFIFSFLPVLVMISKGHYLQNCIDRHKERLHCLPASSPSWILLIALAAFVPRQMSHKKHPCLIAGPKPSHSGVSLAQRVCI